MHILEYLACLKAELKRTPVVGFLGVGASNLALMAELSGSDYPIVIRNRSADFGALPAPLSIVRAYTGAAELECIYEDVIFLSPSARREALLSSGARLMSDAELFFLDGRENCFGISGSDGKSTTTALTALILSEIKPTSAIGNIGTPFAKASRVEYYVAELSSFQLEYMTPRLERALLTNITPNHLDLHGDLSTYINAKLNIFKSAKYTAASPDSKIMQGILRVRGVDTIYSVKESYPTLKDKFEAKNYITLLGENVFLNGSPFLSLESFPSKEWYNIHNALGAISLTLGLVDKEKISHALSLYRGLSHRAEHFLSQDGVDFIDSSIDTTPARCAATLTALCRPVRLILGGRGKGLKLLPIIDILEKYSLDIALYGEAGKEFLPELEGISIAGEVRLFDRLSEAVDWIYPRCAFGDALLLSPAATGYGEFRDFRERGGRFKEFIKKKI